MRKKHFLKKNTAIFLALTLAAAPLAACGEEAEEIPEAKEMVTEADTEEAAASVEKKADQNQKDKTETVYVKASAAGLPEEITVETILKNPGGSGSITDYSELTDILNEEGDEEFTRQADGTILWENHGNDISYKGTASAALPVTERITYELDGKTITADELAGKSGHLKMKFRFTNQSSTEQMVNGKKVTAPIPFLVMSTAFLDEDIFYNVEIENGRLISMDGQNLAIGYAMPGLETFLDVTSTELTEDLDIPEEFTIEADVVNFQLEFTASVVTTGIFSEIEEKDLDDLDDTGDDMEELSDASGELVDATGEMADAMSEFGDVMGTYLEGVSSLDSGVAAFQSAVDQIYAQKGSLNEKAAQLKALMEKMSPVMTKASELYGHSAEINAAATALQADVQTVEDMQDEITAAVGQIQTFMGEATVYSQQVEGIRDSVLENVTAAQAALESMSGDLSASAQSQASAILQSALDSSDLTEEQRSAILNSVGGFGGISVSVDTSQVQAYLQNAAAALNNYPTLNIPAITLDTEKLGTALTDAQTQMAILQPYISSAGEIVEELQTIVDSMGGMDSIIASLQQSSGSLDSGLAQINEILDGMHSGAAQLKEGSGMLASYNGQIQSGIDAMVSAMGELHDGFAEFDEEGIQELSSFFTDDLTGLLEKIRALKLSDAGYNNYGGIEKGKSGECRFIIETEEIGKE